MKIYESIQAWREGEKFTEMSRIGNLPKHAQVSVWVNEGGEEREEPHMHVRLSNKKDIRLSIKTLKGLDGKTLEASVMKEFKKWMLSSNKDIDKITNLEAAILIWNAQEHNSKVKMSDINWN